MKLLPLPLRNTAASAPRVVLAALAWLLFCGFGPERPISMGAASLGRADATVASGINIESLASNPANVKRGKGQAFEVGFLRDPATKSNNFFVSSADNSSPLGLSGGFSLAYESGELANGDKFTTSDTRLVFGAGARSDVAGIRIGAALRKMNLTLKPSAGKEQEFGGWTGDAGLAIDLTGGLMLGAVLRNVLDLEGVDTTRRLAGAIAYGGSKFVIEAAGSWMVDGDLPIYRFGVMIPLGDLVAVRGGFVHDSFIGTTTARQTATAGASVVFGRARFDAGAEMNIADASDLRFGFSLVYFMPFAM